MSKNLILSGSCPVTQYKIENYPEWNVLENKFENYVGVINKNIILTHPVGIYDEKAAFKTLHIFLNLIERNESDTPWIAIHDWSELKWLHNDARKIIFEDLFYNPKLIGSIFFNLSHHLDFQLKLGKDLRNPPCMIEIVNNYEEAIWLSHKFLDTTPSNIITPENQVKDLPKNKKIQKSDSERPYIYIRDLDHFTDKLRNSHWSEDGFQTDFTPDHPLFPLEQIFSSIKMDVDYLRNNLSNAEKNLENEHKIVLESKNFASHLEKQIQQADKMVSLGKMTSGIVHELNNPLTIIKGLAENALFKIKKNKLSVEDFENIMSKINNSLTRILEMNKDLKNYIHPTEESKYLINLHDTIYSLLGFIDTAYKKDNINIITNLNATESHIVADSGKIQQVLMNYLTNAKDALEKSETKTITISTSNKPNTIILGVTDTGEGIEKSRIKDVFKTFYTSKAVGKGTGLGLSIVKSIVEELNGSIKVDSERGKGTTFYTMFPLPEKEEDVLKSEDSIKINYKESFKGLYLYMGAEDTPVSTLLAKTFDQYGLIGDSVASPEEVHEKSQQKDYDLFIINMADDENNSRKYLNEFLKTRETKKSNLIVLIPAAKYDGLKNEFKIWGDAIDGIIKMPFTQTQVLNYLKKNLKL